MKLQQSLPFTVLKLIRIAKLSTVEFRVATVLTVHGIETIIEYALEVGGSYVATVLTVHGIETNNHNYYCCHYY